ncbi:MAG TPA: TonB-dependent receptor [Longimicrobiales bacterium]
MRTRGSRRAALMSGVLPLLSLWIAAPAAAQGRGAEVRGRVVALDTGQPLGAANVVLRVPGREGVVEAGATDALGRFQLTGIPSGRYTLEATYIGYAPLTRELALVAGASVDVGTLRLAVEAISLDEVTVEAERPPVVFAPDRDIYATESLPGSDGGVATELLSSIPDLEVDFDGAIMLRGSTPQIYINGRPAPMEGEALAAFLEQFPADQIERIEVIPNPSARFDAEGSGGIVNIVLREGVELGMNGSVFANVDTRGAAGGGGRATWQRGPLTVHGGAFVRHSDRESTGWDLREILLDDPPTLLRQDTWSENGGLSGSGRLTAELQLGERSVLRAEGRFSDFGRDSERATTTTHMDHLEQVTQRYTRSARSESIRRSMDAALSFEHDFGSEQHSLEIELEFEGGRDGEDERVETDFEVVGPDEGPVPADLTLDDSDERERETTLEIDYVHPWGELGQIEVGYRGRIQTRDTDRLLEEHENGVDGPIVETTSRDFTYDELNHSAYLTLARKLGDFGIQVGTRVQHSGTRFELPTGDAFETSDVDFFPSANVTYEFGEGRRIRLSYSRRTRRPPPWRLNPIDQSTDPLEREVGNPDLEPQYTHSFGLDASASMPWGTLRISPYFRRVANDWARIQRVDEDGVSTTTWENVASQDMYGASLTASVRRPDGWGGFLSLSARGEDRDAGDRLADISGRSFSWSVRGNISGRVVGGLGVRATLSYRPARDVPQGRVGSRVDSSIGLRQRLLDGRMSLSLTARDPFDISQTEFTSSDPTFIQRGQSHVSRRTVAFSVSYSFGGPDRDRGPDDRGGRRRGWHR